MPAGTVARLPMSPVPEEQAWSCNPPTATGAADLLRISTNSSFPPDGPLVRNSEMTMSVDAPAADTGTSSVPATSAEARNERRITRQRTPSRACAVSELLHFSEHLGN